MFTAEIEYLGNLRTSCKHVQSGTTIITDAPIDNKGKGEAFSPTDLVATAYASCMLTIIGIYCQERDIEFKHATSRVRKIMGSEPRRIGKLVVEMDFSGNNWDDTTFNRIIKAGMACPVAKTLGDQVEVEFDFIH
jgi:putative redox protein